VPNRSLKSKTRKIENRPIANRGVNFGEKASLEYRQCFEVRPELVTVRTEPDGLLRFSQGRYSVHVSSNSPIPNDRTVL